MRSPPRTAICTDAAARVFTEHGALMLASVLNSDVAVRTDLPSSESWLRAECARRQSGSGSRRSTCLNASMMVSSSRFRRDSVGCMKPPPIEIVADRLQASETDETPRLFFIYQIPAAFDGQLRGSARAAFGSSALRAKAAENALSLVRRYPHRGGSVDKLGGSPTRRPATSCRSGRRWRARGWTPRTDTPNRYARALLAEVRGREPERLFDALLVAAFIEARSHERLGLLARGLRATAGDGELADSRGPRHRRGAPRRDLHRAGAPAAAGADGEARLDELARARPRSWPPCPRQPHPLAR